MPKLSLRKRRRDKLAVGTSTNDKKTATQNATSSVKGRKRQRSEVKTDKTSDILKSLPIPSFSTAPPSTTSPDSSTLNTNHPTKDSNLSTNSSNSMNSSTKPTLSTFTTSITKKDEKEPDDSDSSIKVPLFFTTTKNKANPEKNAVIIVDKELESNIKSTSRRNYDRDDKEPDDSSINFLSFSTTTKKSKVTEEKNAVIDVDEESELRKNSESKKYEEYDCPVEFNLEQMQQKHHHDNREDEEHSSQDSLLKPIFTFRKVPTNHPKTKPNSKYSTSTLSTESRAKLQQSNLSNKGKTGTCTKRKQVLKAPSNTHKRASTNSNAKLKRKPIYKSHTKQQPRSDILEESPSCDFQISRSKMLADREKDLNEEHSYLMQRSKEIFEIRHESSCDDRFIYDRKHSNTSRDNMRNESSSQIRTKKLCPLCSTCSCSRGSTFQSIENNVLKEDRNPLHKLARSDAEIERALIGRLGRLEKSASWFNHLSQKIRRELKKHRNKIIKKRTKHRSDALNKDNQSPLFLPDAHDDDFEHKVYSAPPFPSTFVEDAKKKAFAFRKKGQPTLTQMLNDDTSDEEQEDELNSGGGLSVINLDDEMKEESNKYQSDSDIQDTNSEIGCATNATINREEIDFTSNDEHSIDENPIDSSNDHTVHLAHNLLLVAAKRESDQTSLWSVSKSDHVPSSLKKPLEYDEEKIKDSESPNLGLDQLLDLFQSSQEEDVDVDSMRSNTSIDHKETPMQQSDENNTITLSQLTPRGKSISQSLVERVENDKIRLEQIQSTCPNWKENIRYALKPKGKDNTESDSIDEIRDALLLVQKKRILLENAKERILQQDTVLDLFELALSESLSKRGVKVV